MFHVIRSIILKHLEKNFFTMYQIEKLWQEWLKRALKCTDFSRNCSQNTVQASKSSTSKNDNSTVYNEA